eukprot:CFRG0002T1
MNKLSRTTALAREIIKGQNGIEVVERLQMIRLTGNLYPIWSSIISTPIYNIGFAVFFFGGDSVAIWTSCLVGVLFGVLITVMKYGYGRYFVQVFPFLCSLVVGLISGVMAGSGQTSGPCAFAMSLASTASFFPGVSLTFAVLEVAYGLHGTGAIRYIYAVISGQIIAVGLYVGNLIGVEYIYSGDIEIMVTGTCDAGLAFQSQYRLIFYWFLYTGAIIVYEQPRRHCVPFFICQGLTYVIYYVLSQNTVIDSGIATFCAVSIMVLLAALLTQGRVRLCLRATMLNPTVLILPTIELLVPGSSVVRQMYLTLVGNSGEAFSQNYVYGALCIALGLLFGEAILSSMNFSLFEVPKFRGAVNNVGKDTLNDPEYMKCLLPDELGYSGCLILLHKGYDLMAADRNGLSDPYVSIQNSQGVKIGRTRIVFGNLEPRWDEAFMIHVPRDPNAEFVFKVKDYNLLTKSKMLGKLKFSFRTGTTQDFNESVPDGNVGIMRAISNMSKISRTFSGRSASNRYSAASGSFYRIPSARHIQATGEQSMTEKAQTRSWRWLMCNDVTVAEGASDEDIQISRWVPLASQLGQGQGQVLISIRWFTADQVFDRMDTQAKGPPDGLSVSLNSNPSACATDSTTTSSYQHDRYRTGMFRETILENDEAETEEPTLASNIDTMRLDVLDSNGEYIPPLQPDELNAARWHTSNLADCVVFVGDEQSDGPTSTNRRNPKPSSTDHSMFTDVYDAVKMIDGTVIAEAPHETGSADIDARHASLDSRGTSIDLKPAYSTGSSGIQMVSNSSLQFVKRRTQSSIRNKVDFVSTTPDHHPEDTGQMHMISEASPISVPEPALVHTAASNANSSTTHDSNASHQESRLNHHPLTSNSHIVDEHSHAVEINDSITMPSNSWQSPKSALINDPQQPNDRQHKLAEKMLKHSLTQGESYSRSHANTDGGVPLNRLVHSRTTFSTARPRPVLRSLSRDSYGRSPNPLLASSSGHPFSRSSTAGDAVVAPTVDALRKSRYSRTLTRMKTSLGKENRVSESDDHNGWATFS